MNMDILNVLENFVAQLGIGLLPLPPKSDTLGGHVPDLGLLQRDSQGIICQQQGVPPTLDGGDSAHKTGFASFCNSTSDQALLGIFESGGIMVRHPTQKPWNNWKNCSRDQLVAYASGCWRAGRLDINQRLLQAHATRFPPFTCQNTERDDPGTTKFPPVGDPMGPHDVMFLRISAGDDAAYLDLLGQFTLQIAIELADPDITVEKNQLMLQSIVCGRLNLYVQVHSNYKENIRDYWSGWRRQPQMAEEFIWVIEQELKRYANRPALPLLPINLLNWLRGIDVAAELKNLDPAHLARLSVAFFEASLKDTANIFINVLNLGIYEAVRQLNAAKATANQIAKALADLSQVPNAIRTGLENIGIPASQIAQAMQAAFPGIPHVDQPFIPHQDTPGEAHIDQAAGHLDAAPVHGDVELHTDVGGGWSHVDGTSGHQDGILKGHTDEVTSPHFDIGAKLPIDIPAQGHIDTP